MASPGSIYARARARLLASIFGETSGRDRLGLACLLAALAGVARAERFALSPPLWLNTDEGYASAMALRLVHDGGLPYVNAISFRGPVMYWTYELLVRLGGAFDVRPIRFAGLAFALLLVLAAYSAAAAAGARLGAGVAALVAAVSAALLMNPTDGLALNGELIAAPFALLSFACVARAMSSARGAWLLAGGMLGAVAFFAKQSLGVHLPLLALWIGAHAWRAGGARSASARVSIFGLGAAAVAAAVIAPYAATGQLRAFVYYFSTYGRDVYLATATAGSVARLAADYFVYRLHGAPLVLAALWIWAGRPRWAAGWAAVANAAAAIPTSVFTGRHFDHYFIPYDATLAVAIGLAVDAGTPPSLGPMATRRARAVLAIAVVALLVWWPCDLRPDPHTYALPRNALDPAREPVGRWVAANTLDGDRIFVWGLRGDIYTAARRYPASRFVYTQFQTGFAPWAARPLSVEAPRVVPDSREQMMADLEQTRPEIVVDAGGSLMDRYMTTYPDLEAYLGAHYCHAGAVGAIPIYRRRRDGSVCAPIPPPPHAPLTDLSGLGAWIVEQEDDARDVAFHPP